MRLQLAGVYDANEERYLALALIRATQGHSIQWLNPTRLFKRIMSIHEFK